MKENQTEKEVQLNKLIEKEVKKIENSLNSDTVIQYFYGKITIDAGMNMFTYQNDGNVTDLICTISSLKKIDIFVNLNFKANDFKDLYIEMLCFLYENKI